MIRVKVDKTDPTDLYEQVAAEIRRAIADGEAKPGERLPPAKDLAAVLDVNTNTVLRALRLLRDEGLLEFRRGRGISVAGTPERSAVLNKARELVVLRTPPRLQRRRARHDHRGRHLTRPRNPPTQEDEVMTGGRRSWRRPSTSAPSNTSGERSRSQSDSTTIVARRGPGLGTILIGALAGGLQASVDFLGHGARRGEVMLGFSESPEFKAKSGVG